MTFLSDTFLHVKIGTYVHAPIKFEFTMTYYGLLCFVIAVALYWLLDKRKQKLN